MFGDWFMTRLLGRDEAVVASSLFFLGEDASCVASRSSSIADQVGDAYAVEGVAE